MFAVLKTGGKQYRVQPGDVLRVEKLAAQAGETVQFNEILMVGGETAVVGAPLVVDAAVQAEVLDQIKGEKVLHFVKRRRKHGSKRTKGHRQQLTILRVTEILAEGAGSSGVKVAQGAGSVPGFVAEVSDEGPAKPVDSASPAVVDVADASAPGKKPTNLLTEARVGTADDLKKLGGIGPKLESMLNANGVFHFDQIAGWNEDEVAYMEDQLSFKAGRIAHDGWIEQAKKFAAEQE